MLREVVCALAVMALGSSMMFARQGPGRSPFNGSVVPDGERIWADAPPAPDSAEAILNDIRENLKKLGRSDADVAQRIAMAKIAIQSQAWEGAREALDDARKIQPANPEIAPLMASVMPHIALPGAAPATNPAVVVKPPPNAVAPAPATPGGNSFTARRQVTPAEINRIRQIEWRPDETPKVPIQIDSETRKKFLAANPDYAPADFNKMPVDEQADLILTKGKEELRKGVKIVKDPASVAEFKKNVLQIVTTSCATTGCHTGSKAGPFVLYTGNTPTADYTDFLVLVKYTAHLKGVERSVVDRDYPDTSLLLQFLLDPGISDTPHPDVPNFRAALRKKDDPRYKSILHWVQALRPISPQYGIDLTGEPGAGSEPPKTSAPPRTATNPPPKTIAK